MQARIADHERNLKSCELSEPAPHVARWRIARHASTLLPRISATALKPLAIMGFRGAFPDGRRYCAGAPSDDSIFAAARAATGHNGSLLMRTIFKVAALAAALAAPAALAVAQDLPKTQFKAIGLNSPTVASTGRRGAVLARDASPKASNGAITADITPLDQMGVDDKTMLRLLQPRRHGLRRHGHLEDGRRRPALRGLRPRRPHARSPTRRARPPAKAWRADHRPPDAEELERQAAGVRRASPPQVFWCRARARPASTTSRARRSASSTTPCATSWAASARRRSAWPSPRWCPRSNNGVVDCGVTGSALRQHRRLAPR
jgi:hypothetical protein